MKIYRQRRRSRPWSWWPALRPVERSGCQGTWLAQVFVARLDVCSKLAY